MLFPKSKIQNQSTKTHGKIDRDHMGQIVLLVVKKTEKIMLYHVRTISSANDIYIARCSNYLACAHANKERPMHMHATQRIQSERRPPARMQQICVRRCMRAFFPCARHGGNFKPSPVQGPSLPESDPTAGEAP